MYWGGLRGAIALAIVLQLPADFEHKDKFVAVVTGAVLFTLLVQGLSIEKLLHKLELDKPRLIDRLAIIDGQTTSKRKALERIPELQAGGLFSSRVADAVKDRYAREIDEAVERFESLCRNELDLERERRILFLRCFGQEAKCYYDMFSKRHLSENAYRRLAFSVTEQVEAMRHHGVLPNATLFSPRRHRFHLAIRRALDRLPGFAGVVRRLRAERTAREYERAWGRHQACVRVLAHLDEMAESTLGHKDAIEEVRARYRHWLERARERIDSIAEQFPEFVQAMQQEVAQRLLVQAQYETIQQEARAGMIPDALADKLLEGLDERVSYPHEGALEKLHIEPTELLRTVPFFRDTPPDEFARAASLLRERITPSGEIVIRQGATDRSVYLIARGVVRVLREEAGESRVLATLVAGEFFGEIGLLSGAPRTATCCTVTPCALYELGRHDLDNILAVCPAMRDSLEQAAREHLRAGS
jgi:CPA1 family monovalent cation:H+ antiporter